MTEKDIFFRPVQDGDDPILFRFFVEGMALQLPSAMSEADKEMLLNQQFLGFKRQVSANYREIEEYIIMSKGEAVGEWRLYRGNNELRLISVNLTHSSRGQGIGSMIIRHLQQESKKTAKPLTLSVACDNMRAIALYQKLGFQVVHEKFPYMEMVWLP